MMAIGVIGHSHSAAISTQNAHAPNKKNGRDDPLVVRPSLGENSKALSTKGETAKEKG